MLVGAEPKQQRFTVHLDVITKRSGFFRAARSDRWLSDKAKPADLQQYDPDIFVSYLHCIYRDAVPRSNQLGDEAAAKSAVAAMNRNTVSGNEYYRYLAELYVLADGLQDPITANLVIDETRRFSCIACLPGCPVLEFAFRHTLLGDGLRKVLADIYVFNSLGVSAEHFPREFLMLVIERSMAMSRNNPAVSGAVEAVAEKTLYAIGDTEPVWTDGRSRSTREYHQKTGDDQESEEEEDGDDDDDSSDDEGDEEYDEEEDESEG